MANPECIMCRGAAADALSDQMIRREIVEEKLANGMTRFFSREFPALPSDELAGIALSIRKILAIA